MGLGFVGRVLRRARSTSTSWCPAAAVFVGGARRPADGQADAGPHRRGHRGAHPGQGFRRYLETAEADQIRFEEGQDLFSRYLPYAIIFGVAERWAKVFDDLAKSGAAVERADLVRRAHARTGATTRWAPA